MKLNHIHLAVRDLSAAVVWFEKVLQIQPGFRNELMAMFAFDAMTLILDAARGDAAATIGFESDDCDLDFRRVVASGAQYLLNRQTTKAMESGPLISKGRAR